MWKITNTANDRSKQELHRTASKLTYEPSIGGVRLRLGESLELDDAHFESVRHQVEGWKLKGIVDFEHVGEAPKPAPVKAEVPTPEAPVKTPEAPEAPKAAPELAVASEPVEEPHPKKGQGKKKLF